MAFVGSICPNSRCASRIHREEHKQCPTCGAPVALRDTYVLTSTLGKGGMGTTYLARDLRFIGTPQEICVVKEMGEKMGEDESAIGVFRREAARLLVLRHEAIPAYRDFFVGTFPDGQKGCFIVQEFVRGESLGTKLAGKGTFSVTEALAVVHEVLDILRYLHEITNPETGQPAPVVHLDIKPDNLISRSSDGRIHLIDFGIASQIQKSLGDEGAATLSVGGYTPGFGAFEQLCGRGGPATDLYSLAVTFLVLVTGKYPTTLADPYAKPFPVRESIELPEELADLLEQMLAFKPQDRPGSAAEVLTRLDRIEMVDPEDAKPAPSRATRTAAPAAGQVRSHGQVGVVDDELVDDVPAPRRSRAIWLLLPLVLLGLALAALGGRRLLTADSGRKLPAPSAVAEDAGGRLGAGASRAPGGARAMGEGVRPRDSGERPLSARAQEGERRGGDGRDGAADGPLTGPSGDGGPPDRGPGSPSGWPDEAPAAAPRGSSGGGSPVKADATDKQPSGGSGAATRVARPGMVLVPAGCFKMGYARGRGDERPPRRICLDAFQMDRHEVTVGEFRRFLRGAKKMNRRLYGRFRWRGFRKRCNLGRRGRSRHPMNCVSWVAADRFCRSAGKRLPTEAEWEYAARGPGGRRHPWGSEEPSCEITVMAGKGGGCGRRSTWPVGSRPRDRSPFGVMDLGGNVWEWTADCHRWSLLKRLPDGEKNPTWRPGKRRCRKAVRGGSWQTYKARDIRASRRDRKRSTHQYGGGGFRCVAGKE